MRSIHFEHGTIYLPISWISFKLDQNNSVHNSVRLYFLRALMDWSWALISNCLVEFTIEGWFIIAQNSSPLKQHFTVFKKQTLFDHDEVLTIRDQNIDDVVHGKIFNLNE